MYRKQVRRRRAVLIGLVLLGFVLLTVTFGNGSGSVGGPLGSIFGPVQDGASRALKPARDLVNWFDETIAARGERDRLTADLADSRKQAVAGQVALQENKQLRDMANLQKKAGIAGGFKPVTATVITRSPTVWYSTVGIDRGSSDGIALNDPVVSPDGLVGHVSSASRGDAVVTLITDSTSAVSAKVVPGGAQGVVRATVGAPDKLVLEFLDQTKNIAKGQSVVTSGWRGRGLSSLYPRNIPIGEVAFAPIDEREAIQSVDLTPYPNMRNLDMLQVLTGGSRG
ncbi:MAG: rod shape-determining protein MreC [Solirubrobacterales bacterium]|nr:rod shape-determining protein MreC [Solirubrobacterales bacterium]